MMKLSFITFSEHLIKRRTMKLTLVPPWTEELSSSTSLSIMNQFLSLMADGTERITSCTANSNRMDVFRIVGLVEAGRDHFYHNWLNFPLTRVQFFLAVLCFYYPALKLQIGFNCSPSVRLEPSSWMMKHIQSIFNAVDGEGSTLLFQIDAVRRVPIDHWFAGKEELAKIGYRSRAWRWSRSALSLKKITSWMFSSSIDTW